MCISRIIEELFPFAHYCVRVRRNKQRCKSNDILDLDKFSDYKNLSGAELAQRLDEERQRASVLDEKTFKLTLSLSVGLMILGLTAAFLIKAILFPSVQTVLAILIGVGLFYILAAGYVALGALRTLPSYGYGTRFLLNQQRNSQMVQADALARQETMNLIRHLRNETAYQALRNGLLIFFAGTLLFASMLVYQSFGQIQPRLPVDISLI